MPTYYDKHFKQWETDWNNTKKECLDICTLGSYIAFKLKEMEKIEQKRLELNKRIDLVEEERKAKLAQIRKEREEMWKSCPHDFQSYIPDASGNNDSYYECDTCGYDNL